MGPLLGFEYIFSLMKFLKSEIISGHYKIVNNLVNIESEIPLGSPHDWAPKKGQFAFNSNSKVTFKERTKKSSEHGFLVAVVSCHFLSVNARTRSRMEGDSVSLLCERGSWMGFADVL